MSYACPGIAIVSVIDPPFNSAERVLVPVAFSVAGIALGLILRFVCRFIASLVRSHVDRSIMNAPGLSDSDKLDLIEGFRVTAQPK